MANQKTNLDPNLKSMILGFQKNELTEYYVYRALAKKTKDQKNRQTLERIAEDEKHHYEIWKTYSNTSIKPKRLVRKFYPFLAKIFGLTFAVKLMERGEEQAQHGYQKVLDVFPETKKIFAEENRHEHELIEILQEEKLSYLGSIVLGLNDALVELTGALAGLSFALQNTRLIALAGTITGIAASMSMAASEYLSKKTEGDAKAFKSAVYTGLTYLTTVILLIIPFLVISRYQKALPISLLVAGLIILAFTFFSAVVQDVSFKKKFFEMLTITFGVALLSFLFAVGLRYFFGIDA